MSMSATLSGVTLIGPRGIRTFHIPSFNVAAADHELAWATPRLLRSCSAGKKATSTGTLLHVRLCPRRGVQQEQYWQYQPPSLGDGGEARSHLFQPKTGWQVNGAVVYGAPTFLYW